MADEIVTSAPSGADRRGFLLRAGGVGVAVVGVAAAGPALAGTVSSSSAGPDAAGLAQAADAAGPLMVYIKDAARGQLAILVGEREVVYTDRAAVANILSAAGR
jgi:hypothetical protein